MDDINRRVRENKSAFLLRRGGDLKRKVAQRRAETFGDQELGLRTVTVITVYGRTVYGPVTVSVCNDVTLQVPYTAPAICHEIRVSGACTQINNLLHCRKLRITAVPYLDRIRTIRRALKGQELELPDTQ
ncbi:hypothetical protein DFH11DRAFT_1545813 [Phellopilus nigrolimitatus]|nr:hypothetical protein DFH11DRAFT_1545813 [Phellopilus nigrolimitatus]